MRLLVSPTVRTAVLFVIAAGTASAAPGGGRPGCALPAIALRNLPAAVRNQFEQAVSDVRGEPSDAVRVGHLAMMLHAHEQYHFAEACYREARRLEPTARSWLYLIGVVQAERGEPAAAVQSLQAAVAMDAAYLPARVRLADALLASGDFDGSGREYTALVRDAPALAVAHYGLGRLSTIRGQQETAALHYLRAVELSPQFGAAHYALALAYRDRADAFRAAQHLDAYRRWGTRRPMPPDPLLEEVLGLKSTARDLISRATKLAEGGRVAESVELHLKAIEVDPAAAQAHVNLISLYGRLDRPDRAEHHYRAAVRLGTSLADAHYNHGVLLASAGRDRDAAAAFRLALEVNPFHAQAHNNLATLLARERRLIDALRHYQQAVANDPGHRSARYNLARSLLILGRPHEAIEHFQRLLPGTDADTAHVSFALANAWIAANDKTNARRLYEQALTAARAMADSELAGRIETALQSLAVGR